ncbi:MAG TPA: hypothetical protein PLL78_10680 [Fimbriimonadaceae bacterium]|nr:hypothetical protein [Fimbriimonadaceae bacterium]HRJ97140.1 hypothetical protein [Fimbriimonadaceae bacterium]
MKIGLLALLFPFALAWPTEGDTLKLEPTYKVGSTVRHSVKLSLVVSGTDAEVTSVVRKTVKGVAEQSITFDGAFEKLKVMLGETEFPVEAEPVSLEIRPSGELVSITGGVIQIDMARLYLAHTPVLPKLEVPVGEKWSVEIPASQKAGIPATTFEGTYVGAEKIGEKEAFKITANVQEKGGEGFSSKATFWLDKDGTVLKFEADMRGLPIPQLGSNVDAKMTGSLVS